MEEEKQSKWQPVVLVMPRRLECGKCGALAVFVALDMVEKEDDGHNVFNYGSYCQSCWQEYVVEEIEE